MRYHYKPIRLAKLKKKKKHPIIASAGENV